TRVGRAEQAAIGAGAAFGGQQPVDQVIAGSVTAEVVRVGARAHRGQDVVGQRTRAVIAVRTGERVAELGLQVADGLVGGLPADPGGVQADHRVGGIGRVRDAEAGQVAAVRGDLAGQPAGTVGGDLLGTG